MINNQYEIIQRSPTVTEHQILWESVGWGTVDIDMTERSISNSVYSVVAVFGGNVVGMGRIVGDGAMYFYIQDVAVSPKHQKKGIGKMIMEELLTYIKMNKLKNGIAFIGLFASQGSDRFYEHFGFKNHSPGMTGMFSILDK
jgi:GNAT superfamily N-acetyltransferase